MTGKSPIIPDTDKVIAVLKDWASGRIGTSQADKKLKGLGVFLKRTQNNKHYCPKCGQAWVVHDSDGSCIKDQLID